MYSVNNTTAHPTKIYIHVTISAMYINNVYKCVTTIVFSVPYSSVLHISLPY